MPRATNAAASHRRKKRVLKQTRGFTGSRSKIYKKAIESLDRALTMSYIGRKQKKRQYRSLWIARLSAACRSNGITYSRFIEGLNKSGIEINRKMLSEIAIHDEQGFTQLVETARKHAAA